MNRKIKKYNEEKEKYYAENPRSNPGMSLAVGRMLCAGSAVCDGTVRSFDFIYFNYYLIESFL